MTNFRPLTSAVYEIAASKVSILGSSRRDACADVELRAGMAEPGTASRYSSGAAEIGTAASGTPRSEFSARTLLGDMVTVGRSDEKLTQVLVVFNTTCQFCMQTLPLWQSVYDSLESQGVSFLGLSHDPDSLTRAYALTHELRFPVVTFPELKLISLYRASRVPLTMVLDDRGVVLYEHVGVLTNSSLDSLHAVVRASPAEDNEDLYRAGGTR